MTQLGDDVADMFDDLLEVARVQLEVSRNGVVSVIDALPGRNQGERFGNDQTFVAGEFIDFIVRSIDWRNEVGGEPELNDFLAWTDDVGETRTAQVRVESTEKQVDAVDQMGVLWRVHATLQ